MKDSGGNMSKLYMVPDRKDMERMCSLTEDY